MKSVRTNIARLFLAAAIAGVASPLALAQPQTPAPTTVQPPTPSKPDDPPAILSLLATVVIIGAVCAPALLNPKRGHQD